MDWIKDELMTLVKEGFCLPCCGKVCDAPCHEMLAVVRRLAGLFWQGYARMN